MAAAFRASNVILVDVASALEIPTEGLSFRSLLRRVIEEATAIGLPFGGDNDFSKLASISELMVEQMGMARAVAATPAAAAAAPISAPPAAAATASAAAAAIGGAAGAAAVAAPAAAPAAATAAAAAAPKPPAGAVAALSAVAPATLAFPEEWESFGDEGGARDYAWERRWKLVAVDPGAPEFASAQAQLLESMQGVTVVRVERIQSRLLWRRYAVKRDEIATKCASLGIPDAAACLRLWHGTGKTDPKLILASESGLDERLASQQGFYGKGVYLAEHARYSNGDSEVRTCVCVCLKKIKERRQITARESVT